MSGFFDFFGFGSKRRTALQGLDRSLAALEVNPAYIDDGMRDAIYAWAQAAAGDHGLDAALTEAAALISFCVVGPAETEALWGAPVRDARERRFQAVLDSGDEDTMDAKLIKLVLAKGIAAPDIQARVGLEQTGS